MHNTDYKLAGREEKVIVNKPDYHSYRVLVVDSDNEANAAIRRCLEKLDIPGDFANSGTDAIILLDNIKYDLLITNAKLLNCNGFELKSLMNKHNENAKTIVISPNASFDEVIEAMRIGAVDFITKPVNPADTEARIQHAMELVLADKQRGAREGKLKRICKHLNTTRLEVTNQVDSLCNDLVGAYQELADQIANVTTVAEFSAIVRQELDIEELLRTALEYLLKKIGPTNAAIFLPDSQDDFSLGAYVNYDCPKDTADFLLDHLADVITPKMVDEERLLEFKSYDDLYSWMSDDAAWLADSHVLVFSCHSEGECLAVFTLFRDITTPFNKDTIQLLDLLRKVFTRQLAHVINVHHRFLPDNDKDDLFGFNDYNNKGCDDYKKDEDDDDNDDEMDGFGGLAA